MKRLLELLISCCVFVVDLLGGACLRVVGRPRGPRCVVLAYHSVSSDQVKRFARQMDIICRHAIPIRVDAALTLMPSYDSVAITFDDGLLSFKTSALPELTQRRIPSTIFVVTAEIGRVPGWTSYSSENMPNERTMTAQELRELGDLVSVGSHSVTHPVLSTLADTVAQSEIGLSRTELQRILGRSVTLFAFPYGDFDDRLVDHCREAGYERVFTCVRALSNPGEFVSHRFLTSPRDWSIEFRLKISGAYRWMSTALKVKQKLIRTLRLRGGNRSNAQTSPAETRGYNATGKSAAVK